MVKKPEEAGEKVVGSLIDPASMGGIIGGGGYDYQTRYIACHLPEWIAKDGLLEVLPEGTGDVDLKFNNANGVQREHIQIKNHPVAASELKDVIETFHRIDQSLPDTYVKFTLACPSLSGKANTLAMALKRIRDAGPFFQETQSALASSNETITELTDEMKLGEYLTLIQNKLHIEAGTGVYHNDGPACDLFVGIIQRHPKYKAVIRNLIQPAYGALIQLVFSNRGRVIPLGDVVKAIDEAILPREPEERVRLVYIHNWEKEREPQNVDGGFDWTAMFDRPTRRVPAPSIWDGELLPKFAALKKQFLEGDERVISVRGKFSLSAGIAFGATFPRAGGWVLEYLQLPAGTSWRSDEGIIPGYDVRSQELPFHEEGDSVVLVFDVTGRALPAVQAYASQVNLPAKALVIVQPPVAPGSSSIANASEATSFAQGARDHLRESLNRHAVNKTHLFFFGPQGLALFLGQRLTSVGEVQLYEFQDPGYVASCRFRT